MNSHLSLKSKIVLSFLGVVITTTVLIGWNNYRQAKDALLESSFNALTAVRDTKRHQIETYFQDSRDLIEVFAQDPSIIGAMRELGSTFHQIQGSLTEQPPSNEIMESVREYYQQEFLPRLNNNSSQPHTLESHVPKDPVSLKLQHQYLVANPNPVGSKHNLQAADDSAYGKAHAHYHPIISRWQERFGFYDIFLVDQETGHIVYSVFKETDYATSLINGPYRHSNVARIFRETRFAARRETARLVDFEAYIPSYNAPASFIATPILDNSQTIGVLIFQLPINRIDKVMTGDKQWQEEGLGATGETYLLGADFKMRNNSRFLTEEPERYLQQLTDIGAPADIINQIRDLETSILFQEVRTEGALEALRGKANTRIIADYRGIPVLSSYTGLNIPDLDWVILSEIDSAEALAPIQNLRQWIIIICMAIASLMTLFGMLLTGSITKPINALIQGTQQLAKGDLSIRVKQKGGEELITLATSFNNMAAQLEATTVSKDYFDKVITSMTEMLIVVSIHTDEQAMDDAPYALVSSINQAGNALLGYNEGEIIDKPIEQILSVPKDMQLFDRAGLEAILKQRAVRGLELSMRTKSGSLIPVLFSASVLSDEVGNLQGLVCVAQDISERIHIEQDLKKNRARLARAQEMAHMGSYEWNLETNSFTCSDELFRIFGFTPGSFTPTFETLLGYTHPEDRERVRQLFQQSMNLPGGHQLECRLVHNDGSEHSVTTQWEQMTTEEGAKILVGVVQDITERRETEDRLEIATRIFDNAAEGVMVTTPDSVIQSINPAFTRITGYSKDEAIGKTPKLLRSDRHDSAFYDNLWRSIKSVGRWEGEIWNRRKNGEAYPQWLTITAVKDPAGKTKQYIGVFHDITQVKQSEEELKYRENHDALTDLANRALFMDRLEQSVAGAMQNNEQLAVMVLDLDLFKHVNESLGHAAGDQILQGVAKRLKSVLPAGDTLARHGGDEFALTLNSIKSPQEAVNIAHHLMQALSEPFDAAGHQLYIKASIGITVYPDDGKDADSLFRNAELAMHRAKQEGRDTYQLFTPAMNEAATERLTIENQMRHGLENSEFVPYMQPKVDARTGKIIGMESLVRWIHPDEGLISPAKFIPLAEETGLVVPMGEIMLRESCRFTKSWLDAGYNLVVAVNLSARQFQQQDLVEVVRGILDETGLPPENLELEITESAVMTDIEGAIKIMSKLRSHGIRLALDDFGTGYSSLAYLKRFPVEKLKIDQSFVRNMHTNSDDASLVKGMVRMTAGLGLRVVAEGVEEEAQLEILREYGCDEIQGYLFSKPVTPKEFSKLLSQQKRLLSQNIMLASRESMRGKQC